MAKNGLIKKLGMFAIGVAMLTTGSGTAPGLERKALAQTPLPAEYSLAQWMTPVQSQGPYNLCYDFAAIAAIEAKLKMANGNPNYNPNLSEQQYPCYDGDYTQGGNPLMVLEFAKSTGIVEEGILSFRGLNSSCSIPADARRYFVKSYGLIQFSNEMTLEERRVVTKQALIEKGPLIAGMTLGGSKDTNGIYKCNGGTGSAHGVVVYGYKETGDIHTSYWEVKDPNNQINKIGMDWNVPPYGNFDQCELTLDGPTYVEVFPANHVANSIKTMKVLTGIPVKDFNLQELDCSQNNRIDIPDAICSLQKAAGLR